MDTLASSEILTFSGSTTTLPKGKIVVVGYPPFIVRIWHTAGTISDFDWKYTSTDVIKAPPFSSIIIDCATGSYHPVCLSDDLVLVTVRSWFKVTRLTSAFLVAIMVSWILSKRPFA